MVTNEPAPGMRWCTWHHTAHPLAEFGMKDKLRGWYYSMCRAGQREYSAQHYRDHRDERLPKLRERKFVQREKLSTIVDAARAAAICGRCGKATNLSAERGGLPTPSDIVRRGGTMAALRDALNDPMLQWVCRSCRGRELGSSSMRSTPLRDRILSHLASVDDAGLRELGDMVAAAGHTCERSTLETTLGRLVKAGTLRRTGRGRYALNLDESHGTPPSC